MATFSLGNVPSPINQALRLAQLREAQNPNLALDRQLQQAVQLQQLQQQSPEAQLALQVRQAQLNSALQNQAFQQQQQAFELQRQPQILEQLRQQLDPNFQAQKATLQALLSGTNPSVILEPQISPETAALRATAQLEGGIPTTAYPQADFTAIVPSREGLPAIGISPSAGQEATALKQKNLVDLINARADAKPTKSPFTQQTVVSLTDPSDVRQAIPDESGRPPAGYQFAKSMEQPMKGSERITATKEVRAVYDELPAKIDMFGKGQLPGSDTLKSRLDTLLKSAGGDFDKLNPQAKNAFIFAMNNLRDPRSATLLREAEQIADRAGILDRFSAYVENVKTGDQVAPQVAKDIYEVITQVNTNNRERLINSLIPLSDDLSTLNKKLTSIGVPKDIQDEVERRIASGNTGSPANASTVAPGTIVKQGGKRYQFDGQNYLEIK